MCKWGHLNFKGAQALWYEFSHYTKRNLTKIFFKTLGGSLIPVLIGTTTKSVWSFGLVKINFNCRAGHFSQKTPPASVLDLNRRLQGTLVQLSYALESQHTKCGNFRPKSWWLYSGLIWCQRSLTRPEQGAEEASLLERPVDKPAEIWTEPACLGTMLGAKACFAGKPCFPKWKVCGSKFSFHQTTIKIQYHWLQMEVSVSVGLF